MKNTRIDNYYQNRQALRLFSTIENIWYPHNREKSLSVFAYPLIPILWVFSWLYRLISFFRKKNANPVSISAKTIVIGNITAGGSGKTPFIISFAESLIAQNIEFGIVSHGYLAKITKPTAVPINGDVSTYGDEALLIKSKLSVYKNIPIYIGRPRAQTAQTLLAENPQVKLIIFDDGLQDPSFYRDLEIVLTSAESFGNKKFIPAGPLREGINTLDPPSRFAKNRMVLPTDKVQSQQKKIKAKVLGGYPLADFGSIHATNNLKPLTHFKNYHWLYFAAFARPWRLSQTIKGSSLSLFEFFYPDHFPLNITEIKKRIKNVPEDFINNGLIVVAEKDAIKIISAPDKDLLSQFNLPILVISYSLTISKNIVKEVLEKINLVYEQN